MNRKMTRLALAINWAGRGAKGSSIVEGCPAVSCPKSWDKIPEKRVDPPTMERIMDLRVGDPSGETFNGAKGFMVI